MKFGVISDIHGNLTALQAVLAEFEKQQVDNVLCLGNVIGIGPDPEACVQTLRTRPDTFCVAGSHELYYTEGLGDPHFSFLSRIEVEHQRWQQRQLSGKSRLFLLKMPHSHGFVSEGLTVFMSHYAMDNRGYFSPLMTRYSEQDLSGAFGAKRGIHLFGCDHTPFQVRYPDRSYICVGSVGCPEGDAGIANAGILEVKGQDYTYNQIKVGYDLREVVKRVRDLDYPDGKTICEVFYHS